LRADASYDQLYNFGCYAGPEWVITPPEPGQFGTMGRNVVRGPDFVNLDFSVIKTFTLRERLNMELRGEFFNGLNRPNLPGQAEIFITGFTRLPVGRRSPAGLFHGGASQVHPRH